MKGGGFGGLLEERVAEGLEVVDDGRLPPLTANGIGPFEYEKILVHGDC